MSTDGVVPWGWGQSVAPILPGGCPECLKHVKCLIDTFYRPRVKMKVFGYVGLINYTMTVCITCFFSSCSHWKI